MGERGYKNSECFLVTTNLKDFLKTFVSVDDQTCEFEINNCGYEPTAEDENFKYKVKTAATIEGEGIKGPKADHLGSRDGKFVFATGNVEGRDQPVAARLAGPVIQGSQIEFGCVDFKYNLSVSSS